MHYNPFHYIRSEKDILKLVNTIIANTKGDGEKSGEDFWVKAERLLYCALIGYIYYEAPEEEQNFSTLLEFINASEAREDDEEFKNPVDELFEDLEKAKPEHFAVRQYKKYKLAAGKTAKSILISCGARLAPFDIKELRDLMAYDEMELDMLGDQRTAMFVIISDTDDTFNFVVSILYTQLFNLLCDKADDEHGGRLPYHVRLLLDEFANIGQIPKFDKLIATIRSREISASIILQSQSQLKTIYKDAAETIIGNCDTMLFLGGKESSTLKEISETLGKETIDLYNTSDTRGNSPSFGTNYQKTGKELMSRDELAVMDGSKCILQLRGVRPFLSDKFDITKHKSKKNNNDRTQYRQKNHHEAIVSREVFNAANHLRASRNYSKKNRPLPVLSVVEDGILRGYVPFDKDWTGFSAEEYREASESVMKEPDVTVTADVKKRLDLTGYEIVRVQYFSTMQNPAMTISNGRLRFNTACLKKFENVEYVELLLNSVERCIAIRPCDKNNPNAIRWGRLKEGRWCASTLGCRGLAKTLFDIMEWDEDLRYRFRGQFLEQGDNKMMLFAFDEPEMIKVEEIVLPPKENTEEDEGETVKKKIYIFPPEWAGTFGQPITSIAQVGILRQEHYAGNWDVFRPATEIEEMNIFTAESLNELLREAEKIMEGWTDYR